jgi:hypothetical protein
MAEFEARGIEYILGARERSDKEVREIVLADTKPMVPLAIPRARGKVTEIEVKEVIVGDWGPSAKPRRYIVCFNPQEAKRDAAVREEIVRSLAAKLDHGDKGLVGNAATAASSPPRAMTTSRSIPTASPRMPASMGSTFCAPTASSTHSRWPSHIANFGAWSKFSGPQRRSSRPARSITKTTPPLPVTSFVHSSHSFCAKNSTSASPPLVSFQSGPTWSVISTGSRR